MDFRGKWVWVTGASSGLGREIARQLATEHGANLIVTARRKDRLDALKAELEAAARVEVRSLAGDMSVLADVDRLFREVREVTPLAAAVLNAGVTHFGKHVELEWAAFESMLQTNIVSTVRLTTELVKHLEGGRAPARIMLVTSMAGLMPVPYQSAYSGTKAFLNAWGVALAQELEGSNVSLSIFAPGGVATEMTSGEKFGPLSKWLAPVEDVAREAVYTLHDGPVLRVPGAVNRLGLFMSRLLPRNVILKQLAATYRNALAQTSKR
jgi:short-subunit dehydrogenase